MNAKTDPKNGSSWGEYGATIQEWIGRAAKQQLARRIWDKDASAWKKETAAQKEIKTRLGWLLAPSWMRTTADDLVSFASQVRRDVFQHVVLLGMGGSSLAPEVFASTFGSASDYPELLVLDSTDPGRVKDLEAKIDLDRTLFVVSSKSGGTIELLSLFKYFYDRLAQKKGSRAGDHFIAITDAGTPLVDIAKERSFRRTFLAPEDIGGRFSALTVFGLLPAAMIGVDIRQVLESAVALADRCRLEGGDNPGLELGVALAVLAESGRDKLTILASPGLESFGDWVEQLVAESTGKEGSGIVPVVREAFVEPASYGSDRFFVAYSNDGAKDAAFEERVAALAAAGHPVLRVRLKELSDLGAEFFRWEFATAVCCALMKINAFDQPDVQAAKDRTKALLKTLESQGTLPDKRSEITLEAFWENAEEGDYVAILAFLPDRPELREKLLSLQQSIRSRTRLAVTLGFGPRYLHSTGQLHKGGPNNGVYLLISAPPAEDLAVPGEKYSFGQLELAQAMGDFEALESRGRWLYHARLTAASAQAITDLEEQIGKALEAIPSA